MSQPLKLWLGCPQKKQNISGDCDPDEKDDVQLTSADVGDNMEDI